ncbi:hypothetical protein MLD38_022333 [Melastoma candidum]|uniref:Uncharacterized protein n=1 Tax=Melastoma candidum TaxID=119954 RepID=A0ACB9QS18_9MYRT|nr:hypothetical protein MLD38_022333 [Melastoma candidum]
MELVRGKSARFIADLVSLLTSCKGLPLAYNRDLQEDEEPTFDSVKAILGMLEVSAEFAQNIVFNKERILKGLLSGHLDATTLTLTDYLVIKGIPFRRSHDIVGRSVALCVSKWFQLQDLSLDELKSISSSFEQDVYEYLGVDSSIKSSAFLPGLSCPTFGQRKKRIDALRLHKIGKCSLLSFVGILRIPHPIQQWTLILLWPS